MESSAGGTSPCRGCTAAVPRPPSPPPERWNCGTIPTILTHPGYPWLAGAGARVPVCLSLHLAGRLFLPKLPPWTATTAGGWIPPGFRDRVVAGDCLPPPATALLLLLLVAVTGAGQVLLQGHLLLLRPCLRPGVRRLQHHRDRPPVHRRGHAGHTKVAQALASHHVHLK